MDLKSKNLQLQYQGYLTTPVLWKRDLIMDLKQFELTYRPINTINEAIPDTLRLGKRVERFVSAELQQAENIEILVENIQIQNKKITIGEIDCILKLDGIPIHLEIIYKFYLYDSKVGKSEIEHWIGPNRNDNLLKKLTKLKNKQLPLIYNEHTKPLLSAINLNIDNILQRVYFKAQLFTPYKTKPHFNVLNEDCLKGFYIHISKINLFNDCKFYIPNKIDWLKEVEINIDWLSFNVFEEKIILITNKKSAPLCWIKHKNGTLQKFFVTWWN